MTRIVYMTPSVDSKSGGNKMVFRHVEALRAAGFDAVVRHSRQMRPPVWFQHEAPTEDDSVPLRADDILVLPEDALEALRSCATLPNRKVLFCQNPYALASYGLAGLPPDLRSQYRTFMACGVGVAGLIARFFDYELISVVPAFADERLFRPAPKEQVIACSPRQAQGGADGHPPHVRAPAPQRGRLAMGAHGDLCRTRGGRDHGPSVRVPQPRPDGGGEPHNA